MARPRKVPAVLVEATIKRNAKLAALPSDAARLGYFYVVLGDAKLSEPVPGQFASKAVFRVVAGRWARYLDDYVGIGLLELAPKLCARCKVAWSTMPPKSGVLVVHDWHQHQYDPRKIERQREYDERQRSTQDNGVSDGVSDAQSDAKLDRNPVRNEGVSDGVSDAKPVPMRRTPRVPAPSSAEGARDISRSSVEPLPMNAKGATANGVSHAQLGGVSDGVSDGNLTVISRAGARGGGRRRAPNVERERRSKRSTTLDPKNGRARVDGPVDPVSSEPDPAWMPR